MAEPGADVIVIGAGPVGLLLSAELTRLGCDVVVLEKRPAEGDASRAIGVHAPVLAALEDSGITDRLLANAMRVPRGEARSDTGLLGTVRFDRLSMRFPFVATLPQPTTEAALAHGGPGPVRGVTVRRIAQDASGVRIEADAAGRPREWRGALAVVTTGSGGRDLVYRPGAVPLRLYPDRYLMADVEVGERPESDVAIVTLAPGGVLESFPLPGGWRRFVVWDGIWDAAADGAPPVSLLGARLRRAVAERGDPDAAERITTATAFRVRRAVAPALRHARVLVAGDAAHEVSPIGGQGMNLGLLDAALLAPLLAQWVRTGVAPDAALSRWERRRVRSARIAASIAAVNTALGRPRSARGDAARTAALRSLLALGGGRVLAHTYAMGFDLDA